MSDLTDWSVGRLAAHIDATVVGDASLPLQGVSMTDNLVPGTVTYAMNPENFRIAEASEAAAIIVGRQITESTKPLLQADVPKAAFAKAIDAFHPRLRPAPGRHPSAVIANSADVDATATIGPHAFVGEEAHVGANTVLHAGAHVEAGAIVGSNCELFNHVVLYAGVTIGSEVVIHAGSVLGSAGFGYVFDDTGHRPVPQVGTVTVGDNVHIGANVCIDCGTLGETIIGTGVRIDNLVEIAHNVQIGDYCVVISQAGIAGSTDVGAFAVIGPQAGLKDHVSIAPGAVVLPRAGVMRDIPAGNPHGGDPARPKLQLGRELSALSKLPATLRRLRQLEKRLDRIDTDEEGA